MWNNLFLPLVPKYSHTGTLYLLWQTCMCVFVNIFVYLLQRVNELGCAVPCLLNLDLGVQVLLSLSEQ